MIFTLQLLGGEVVVLELEVQVVHLLAGGLVLLEVQVAQVGVLQSLSNGDSLFGVEGEQFLEEVDGVGVCEGEELVEVLAVLLVLGEVLDELLAFLWDVLHVLKIRCSEVLAEQLYLVLGVSSRQEGFALRHLREDAADTPHVHRCGVVVGAEEQLRGAVPSCGHILSEHVGLEVLEKWAG